MPAGGGSSGSVSLVLGVPFAVERVRGLVLLGAAAGVAQDPRGRVLVAVRGVLDQLLLGELEALRLAAAGLLDRAPLLAAAPRQGIAHVRRRLLVHCAQSI